MIEGDTFQPVQKPINKIQTVIQDSFLSEFKYHFIIKKLPIIHLIHDRQEWTNFISNLYKGFKAHFMGHNSVHIVQFLNLYPQSRLCDLIVGLRRDQHALKFYREICVFELDGVKCDIEVAEGFKTYLDEMNEKCRLQAAQRQKIRAQENQLCTSQTQQKPKNSPIFIRQASNPISAYQSKSDSSFADLNPEQGEIVDTPRKNSVKRKSSSEDSQSASSKSGDSKDKKYKSNSKQKSSYDSRSDRVNRNHNSNNGKSYRHSQSSRSSSSGKSSGSVSSSRSSRNSSYYGKNGRNERSRDKRSYLKESSSQYSSNSSYHKNSGGKRRNNTNNGRVVDGRRSGRDDKEERYSGQKKYEQNRRYDVYTTPSYNKTYSSNYNDRLREPPEQMTKKYSYQAYNAYRAPTDRYEGQYYDYQKQGSSSSSYNYYKNPPGYPFPKPSQFEKKELYNPNNSETKQASSQPQYNRYGGNSSKGFY